MSRRCSLTGKEVQCGHNVSKSNRRTNRRFQVNLQKVSLVSNALGRVVPLRISTRALRTVQKKGGLDAFLLSTAEANLGEEGVRLKRQVHKRLERAKSS